MSGQMDPVDRLEASFNGIEPGKRKRLVVYDCRFEREAKEATGEVLDAFNMDFNEFIRAIKEAFSIPSIETFVLCTTDRAVLDFDSFEALEDGNTVHVLQKEDQVLGVATKEVVTFVPHYATMVQSGRYEYYASAGQKALPYALAELIDNALSATSRNTGSRTIEIRLLFDETLGKPAVVVLDNGHGMSSKQLSNWAVYRLSKFNRKKSQFESESQEYTRPDPVYRSINSDISYFGVGGKQAVFYIGDCTRMITRPVGCPDVHELIISKDQFEKKEKNKEDIYSGVIRNRKVGDSSHVKQDDDGFLRDLIAEEFEKESFTAVVITGVQPDHIATLKQDFEGCMRELAHVYHYYIHGPHGNMTGMSAPIEDPQQNIDIQITLREKPTKIPCVMNLRQLDDDMQTLYINATTDTFEFKAEVEGGGKVEGVLRYHPFMYDRETYPEDPHAMIAPIEDDDETDGLNEARGKRDIFECFWNGRLIPYTTVSEFDWCKPKPSKGLSLPAEVFSRFSGVLFTDDAFQVSTNKLTFTDLEPKLRSKGTIFTRIVNGQEQRVKIQKEFTQWLASCHEEQDKQVKFETPKTVISRPDVATKKKQYPWTTFSSIEWDGKRYKTGQLVKSQKTQPILIGTIVHFLLYGTYDDDVYATVGYVQLALEPKALHEEPCRALLISKIDRTATNSSIKKIIDGELAKLPDKLNVSWPDGNEWPQNAVYAAGTALGPLRVDITNKKGELISRFPTHSSQQKHSSTQKLEIELKVVWHGPDGDQEITCHIAKHGAAWGYWFKPMENLDKLGKHTLYLKTVLDDSNTFGGKPLPIYSLSFTITEANAERFVVCAVTAPLHVGVPFDLPLEIKDKFGNPALPPPGLKPLLECSGDVDVSFQGTNARGTSFTITGVKARGKVHYHSEKQHDLKVSLPGLSVDSQTVKISLLPGNPHSIYVKGKDKVMTVENGNPIIFDVEIHDEAGNIAAHPKLIVCCEVFDTIIPISKNKSNQMLTGGKKVQQLPSVAIDCSSTGAGRVTTEPIKLKNMKRERRNLKAKFAVPSQKGMAAVMREVTVVPSTRVSQVEIWSQEGEDEMTLKNKEKIEWVAGDSLENLFYRLYDEGGKAVPLSEEHAAQIKVNWSADGNLEDLALGKLPVVQVPTLVKDQHFYQVSYQGAGGSVETSFTVVPRPDAPTKLKSVLAYVSNVRIGDTLPGYIFLQLNDKYGNVTDVLTSTCIDQLTVDAEGLDKQKLGLTWQESNHRIAVSGIRFLSGTLGARELSFTWKSFSEVLRIMVNPGAPAQLKLLSGPELPLQVLNEQGIPTPFLIQLCDEWGNPSPDQRVVVMLRSTSSALKVKTNATSQPVDAEGKAKFTVLSVHGAKGEYTLQFSGTFNKKPMPCPSVKLTIVPNPNKPVSLQVEYDDKAVCPAGGTLPVFSAFAASEEGVPVKGINPAAMSMFLWKAGAGAPPAMPPSGATQLKCSRPMENENEDCLYFRDKGIPERTGKYITQFVLAIDETKNMCSKQFAIKVVANTPVTLAPDSEPATPVVSNSDNVAHRTLAKDMTVKIVDVYSNPAVLDVDGKVVISIKSLSEAGGRDVPLFDGRVSTLKVNLLRGSAYIKHLSIMSDSPGEDGKEYVLHFKPEIKGFSPLLAAYELKFRFYNDADNQRQMAQLSQKRDELVKRISAYKDIFTHYNEFYKLLKGALQDADNKAARLKTELRQVEVDVTEVKTVPDVERCIQQKRTEAERIISQRRRTCSIPDPYKLNVDVLGKVCYLALVEDEDAAAVISWHLGGELDCVVTKTTTAAQKIHADARGKQEVLPLDSVYVHPGNNRPLPHIRNGQMLFYPRGNPVFAKDLLIYPTDQADCEKLFKSLLGETILMDDLHTANEYRKAVVQMKINCSTILTRRGERISARGKFGGGRNQAPPIERLGGRVFGAPIPQKYYDIAKQIDVLDKFQTAMKKKMEVQTEHEEHVRSQREPEMLRKKAEMEQAEKELEEVDNTLASANAPSRTSVKRGAAEAPGNPAKRPKQSLLGP